MLGNVGSQSGAPVVNFVSGTALDAANGFANITGDTAGFHNLTISVPGYLFGNMMFDVKLQGLGKAVDLTISAFNGLDLLGTLTLSQSTNPKVQKNVSTSFLVLAEGDAAITSIVLQSTSGFKEAKRFQFSELEPICVSNCDGASGDYFVINIGIPPPTDFVLATVETPIPGAFLLMGTVLVGAGGIAKWRRRRTRS